jgi:N-methylhydantoinase A
VETVSERRLSGQPVRFRSLAVESIGAGGGSIAWRDRGEALRVGPRSAGAVPGPACYGRGGEEATVTDACLVLGYIGPEAAFGGLHLDADRAWRAVESLGVQFGLAAPEAAAGIVEIANAAMARAVRTVSVQRGHDVRQCCLIAYGGAGPIHAGRLAHTLGMPSVLVPPHSSAFSAFGCLAADLRYDAVRTVRLQLLRTEPAVWEGMFREVEVELLTQLEREGVLPGDIEMHRSMDLRYIGQNSEIEVPAPSGEAGDAIRSRFVEAHRRRYDYATDEAVEGVNLRVAAIVPTAPPPMAFSTNSRPPHKARGRQAYFYGSGRVSAGVYSTGEIAAGRGGVIGPAILEDTWSTIVVYPGQRVRRDRRGYVWIEAA